MRTLTAAVLGVAMTLGAATFASADCQKSIRLVASPAGKVIAADARARVRAQTRTPTFVKQDFVVEMSAAVANGTTFMVFANAQPVGTITIVFGVGRLVVNNDGANVLPAGANPVCAISSIIVTDAAGNTILSGTF